MSEIKKVLAICGSTRIRSTNLNFIHAIASLAAGSLQIEIYEGLTTLPHFNPDLDTNIPPPEVTEFRRLLTEADGVLICTPEYAMGAPGTLKNALDWTVSSGEFSKKPVALVTAATSGAKAHESLIGTLKMIEAEIGEETQLLISFAKTKVNHNSEITDQATLTAIQELISSFIRVINNRLYNFVAENYI